MAELLDTIEFPNGNGYTPCSVEYRTTIQAQADLTNDGQVNIDDLSPEDYQQWNVLEHKLLTMQDSGEHLGKSVIY